MEFTKSENEYNMFDWWKKVVIDNYFNFEGRARRSEYWYFTLVNLIIVLGIYAIGAIGILAELEIILILTGIVMFAFAILLIIPSISVAIRRLHDTNKSGWWYLIGLIPLGGIVLLVFYCTDGDYSTNEYGEPTK